MKDYTDRHFAYLDKQLETMRPKSPYSFNTKNNIIGPPTMEQSLGK